MAFKTPRREVKDFSSPQEMFQDNKLKTIKGILDYQSQMLDNYLETIDKSIIKNKNVALEMPTGSGKTLVGALIAEFHRRKYGRQCLFLCPTNQLVDQVCKQCCQQYGINAIPFTGPQSSYAANDKSKYSLGQAIGVTTYSSFFAANSFFNYADILIFDDVHSSENYIVDNWSLNIERTQNSTLFFQVASLLEDILGPSAHSRLYADDPYSSDIINWNDLVPRPKLVHVLDSLMQVLHEGVRDTNLIFAWNRIADNLADCQIYVSWSSILIRPYIPPTETHGGFNQSSQRIFMSATLGNSGELERITGCKKIKRLPIVSDWDTKGVGRRLFIFPDLSFTTELHETIILALHKKAKRSVAIVPNRTIARELSASLKENIPGIDIFTAKDLISSKDSYSQSANAMVILANRFDGIDFPDNESRMLFVYYLPKVTHLQESFFVSKMAASVLYAERIKTRIVQAVGRCTRNASDYSVVCVLGDSIQNELTSPKIQATYHPELRAEIRFGVENSTDLKDVDDIIENIDLFYSRGADWADAESYIVDLRDHYVSEGYNAEMEQLYDKLLKCAEIEVDIQYDIWKRNYQSAYEKAIQLTEILNAPSLSGYKCYWQYVCGCLALEIGNKGKAKCYFTQASNNNRGNVRWLPDLIAETTDYLDTPHTSKLFFDIVDAMEKSILQYQINNRFEAKVHEVLDGLLSATGHRFENAHLELGALLGYNSQNSDDNAAPDPYWLINDDLCVVAEDKIYEDPNKKISVDHVTQAARHKVWVQENVATLDKNAKILTIMVSNSTTLEASARIFAKDIYYVNREELHIWASRALNTLRTVRSLFSEAGDANWRMYACNEFYANDVSPESFIKFITKKKLCDI